MLVEKKSFQSTYKSTLRIEVPVWPDVLQAVLPTNEAKCQPGRPGTTPPLLPDRSQNQGAAPNPHAQDNTTTEPPGAGTLMRKKMRRRMTRMYRRRDKDASPSGKASCSEPRTLMLHGALAISKVCSQKTPADLQGGYSFPLCF